MPRTENVEITEKNHVVFVWEGILPQDSSGDLTPAQLEEGFADNGFRVQYLEQIITKPNLDKTGLPVPDTGGRSDLLFALHGEDITKFAPWRFQWQGLRWLEDVYFNGQGYLYPARIRAYVGEDSWADDKDSLAEAN